VLSNNLLALYIPKRAVESSIVCSKPLQCGMDVSIKLRI
jgi:hypothetical protein